jgi:hypothetical protein
MLFIVLTYQPAVDGLSSRAARYSSHSEMPSTKISAVSEISSWFMAMMSKADMDWLASPPMAGATIRPVCGAASSTDKARDAELNKSNSEKPMPTMLAQMPIHSALSTERWDGVRRGAYSREPIMV